MRQAWTLLLLLAPTAAFAQQYEIGVEVGLGSGIEAITEEGYGDTGRLATFATLHVGYQWEGDTAVELGLDLTAPVEKRAGLLLAPQLRLNRTVADKWWIFGGIGGAADVLPEARFGAEVVLGGRYDVLDVLAVYLTATSDLFMFGPGVGHQGLDLALRFTLGVRTHF